MLFKKYKKIFKVKKIKFKNIIHFFRQRRQWLKLGGHISVYYPILTDYNDEAGTIGGHYFHQDLLVANFIFKNNPKKHIDIGSRIDGFVAHIASFRKIEVIDIRPIKNNIHENINFIQMNFMNSDLSQITDSLSCLHAIEHFGLGRYNDPIDPKGHIKGLENLIKLLKLGGYLYISFPISTKDEIYFNAHRVFHPLSILKIDAVKEKLTLERFDYIDDNGNLHLNKDILEIKTLPKYGCGIYTFKKINN